MSAQLESLIVDLQVNSAALKTGLDKANARLATFAKKADTTGKIVAGALAFKAAGATLGAFAKQSLHAFMAMERADKQLSGALTRLNYDSAALSKQLKSQAGAFQTTLGLSDDMITGMQTMLVTFGVAPKDIEKTTLALLDYSVAMGEDGLASTKKFVNAIETGSTKSLKAMGITVADTGNKAKNLSAAVDALAGKFGGSAAANADTLAGKVETLGNQWEDLQKSFGGFLAQLDDKLGIMEKINFALAEYNYRLGSEREEDDTRIDREKEYLKALEAVQRAKEKIARSERFNADPSNAGYMGAKDIEESRKKMAAELAAAQAALAKLKAEKEARIAGADKPKADLSKTEASAEAKKNTGQTEKSKKAAAAAAKKEDERSWVDIAMDASRLPAAEWAGVGDVIGNAAAIATISALTSNPIFAATQMPANRIGSTVSTAGGRPAMDVINAQDRLANAAGNAAQALKNEFVPGLGKVGALIDAAQGEVASKVSDVVQSVGGGASVGGVIGAIVGVIASLLSESSGFVDLVNMVGTVVGVMADALNPIIEPITRIVAGLLPMAGGLVSILGLVEPIGALLNIVADMLIPLFAVFGAALAGLAPVMKILAGLMMFTLAPILLSLTVVVPALFEIIKLVGRGILWAVIGIGKLWNGMVDSIAKVLDDVANFKVPGTEWTPFESLAAVSNALKGTTIPIADLEQQLKDLNAMTMESANAAAAAAVAKNKETDAVKKATEAFLNAPAGYKTALARFNAIAPSGGSAASSPGPALPVFGKPVALPTQEIIVTVKIDGPEIFEVVDAHAKKQGMRKKGSRFASP